MHIAKYIPLPGGSNDGEEDWDDYDQRENGLRDNEEEICDSQNSTVSEGQPPIPPNPDKANAMPAEIGSPESSEGPIPIDPALLALPHPAGEAQSAPATILGTSDLPSTPPLNKSMLEPAAGIDEARETEERLGLELEEMEEDHELANETWDETINKLDAMVAYLRRQRELGADPKLAQQFKFDRGERLLKEAEKRDHQRHRRTNQEMSVVETYSQHDPESRRKRRRL